MYYVRIAGIHARYKLKMLWIHIKFGILIGWVYFKEYLRRFLKRVYWLTMPRRCSVALGAWVDYASGFSGTGPSLLDKKPDVEPTWFGKWLIQDEIYRLKVIKWAGFRRACIEVMGEDPEEW